MAKKAATKPSQTKGQPGKKLCPDCQKPVGTRTRRCDCGYEFPSTTKPGKTAGSKNLGTIPAGLSPRSVEFVRACGSLDQAQQELDEIKRFVHLAKELDSRESKAGD